MTPTILVLGAGYAGTAALKTLEDELDPDADLLWVSETDNHLVRHEIHRAISDPTVRDHLTLSVDEIRAAGTRFVRGEVVALDAARRRIRLRDGSTLGFDYALVALGSRTAFYGVDGLREHALTLRSLDDALAIHRTVTDAGRRASTDAPAQIVIGGGGLTGVQCAGEIARLRDAHDLPVEISVVDANERLASNYGPAVGRRLREHLRDRDVDVVTGYRIGRVDARGIYLERGGGAAYDVLVWAGGTAGPEALADATLDRRGDRLDAGATFRTSDERVFAVGDCALVDRPDGGVVPPTAEAALEGGAVAGRNLARAMRGDPLEPWSYENSGTLVSVGSAALAHDVEWLPVEAVGGPVARFCKKAAAARWIARVASWRSAATAWPDV
jgi:NADH dehydrogenase